MSTEMNNVQQLVSELKNTQSKMVAEHVDPLLKQTEDRIVNQITTEVEKQQKEAMDLKNRVDSLEALASRPSVGEQDDDKKEQQERKSRMEGFLRKGFVDGQVMTGMEVQVKAMSTDNDPSGGYLVRPEIANFMAERIFETSPLRQVARVVQGSADHLEANIDDDEAAATWGGQGNPVVETATPQIGKLKIFAHKIVADPRITEEQLQDSYINPEAWLQGKLADKFARTENNAFVVGNGVDRPKGFLSYDATTLDYERGKLQQVNSGASGSITIDGLIELQNSLKEPYQNRAVFMMKRSTLGSILKLKSSDNYHILGLQPNDREMPGAQLSGAQMLGRPIVLADDMPVEAVDSLSVAYGDFSVGYTIYDRIGLTILRDPYSNKGFVTYYTTKRTGGAVTNYEAIKLQKLAV